MVNTPVASRKESLRRFISKRKGRYTATAPDSDPEPASKKGKQLAGLSRDEAATWLALCSLGGGMHARSGAPAESRAFRARVEDRRCLPPPPSGIGIRGLYTDPATGSVNAIINYDLSCY
jgi:hypothetical protein